MTSQTSTLGRHPAREIRRMLPRRRWRTFSRVLLLCLALAAVLAAGRTPQGAVAVANVDDFLDFFSGVFSLLTLTAAVVAGLIAALPLPIGLRILAQAAHRAAAIMSVTFLVCHVLLKILERHATVVDIAVPFLTTNDRVLFVGLGTIASDLMVMIFAIGVARGRFISSSRAWVWRLLHITAYASWPIAIVHGLTAGRPAKLWVTMSYVVCFGLVAIFALVRGFLGWRRRRAHAPRPAPTPARRPAATRPSSTPAVGSFDEAPAVPDEEFWSQLRAEAAQWTGGRR